MTHEIRRVFLVNSAFYLLDSIGSSLKSLSFQGDTNFDSSDASLFLPFAILKPLRNFFRAAWKGGNGNGGDDDKDRIDLRMW